MSTATLPEIEIRSDRDGNRGGRGLGGDGRNDRPGSPGRSRVPPNSYRLGTLFALGSIIMLFIAFTSAYIYRQGISFDWKPLDAPPILWFNTAVLLVSSATFELSRRALRREAYGAFQRGLSLTTGLGIVFLLGQYEAWRELAAQGIYLGTNPHSSFFYLLTGAHAVHLMGGVIALGVVLIGAWRHRHTATERIAVDCAAIYWHFMDGLWVYLFLLLFLWR